MALLFANKRRFNAYILPSRKRIKWKLHLQFNARVIDKKMCTAAYTIHIVSTFIQTTKYPLNKGNENYAIYTNVMTKELFFSLPISLL